MNPESQFLQLMFDKVSAYPMLALIGLISIIYLVYTNFFKSKKNDAKRDTQKEESSEEQNDEEEYICTSCGRDVEEGEYIELKDIDNEDENFVFCKECVDKSYPREIIKETAYREPTGKSNEKDYNINDNYFEETE